MLNLNSTTFDTGSGFGVTVTWSDPTVLTGGAALLYLWNPTANVSGGTINVVGGGGGVATLPGNPETRPSDIDKIKERIKRSCLKRKERERASTWNQRLTWGCAAGAVVGAVTVGTAGTVGVGVFTLGIGAPIGGVAGVVTGGILGCAGGVLSGAVVGATQDLIFGVGNPEKECSEEAEKAVNGL